MALTGKTTLRLCQYTVGSSCRMMGTTMRPTPNKKLLDPNGVEGRKHKEQPRFPREYSVDGPVLGKIYDKKPFKMMLEAGKTYAWCTCGTSKNQPLCDGSHRSLAGTGFLKMKPKFLPLRFKAEESKEVWLCNCKQTENRPYCDGTHKQQHIQDAVRS